MQPYVTTNLGCCPTTGLVACRCLVYLKISTLMLQVFRLSLTKRVRNVNRKSTSRTRTALVTNFRIPKKKAATTSDVVLEYSTRTRVQLEYHFLSTRTRNPRYSAGTRTRRSMYSVLGKKKTRVHEYIWPSLKVINKMNI